MKYLIFKNVTSKFWLHNKNLNSKYMTVYDIKPVRNLSTFITYVLFIAITDSDIRTHLRQ